jgi:hypothetical protein
MDIINLLLTNILSSNSLELSLLGEAIFKAFWRCTKTLNWRQLNSYVAYCIEYIVQSFHSEIEGIWNFSP